MALRSVRRVLLLRILAAGLVLAGAAAHAEDKPAAKPADGEGPRAVFLDIDRIVVSVFRGAEIDRHEMLLMKLELADDTVIVPVQQAMPRLRDAFIRSWNMVGARPDAAEKGLDIAAGRQRMIAVADQIVGKGAVRNVLIVGQSSRSVAPKRR